MKTSHFINALSGISEKYVREMLDETAQSDQAVQQPAPAIPAAETGNPEAIPETAHENEPKHVFSRIIRYMILAASAAACIGGISLLMLMDRSHPDKTVKDSLPEQTTVLSTAYTTTEHTVTRTDLAVLTETVLHTGKTSAAVTDLTTASAQTDLTEQTTETEQHTTEKEEKTTQAQTTTVTETTEATTAAPHLPVRKFEYKEPPAEYFLYDKNKPMAPVYKEDYNGVFGRSTLNVYLPAGYDESKQYDVLYLMHGGGENAFSLFYDDEPLLLILLDRMIENGEIEPLIVVTPTFNTLDNPEEDMWEEMREAVIPFVEGKYSTFAASTDIEDLKASRMHRAYGGFSVGGRTVWNNMIHNLDLFAYFIPLSGEYSGEVSDLTDAIDSLGFRNDEYFVFAATGTEDIAYENMTEWINKLKADPHFTETDDFSQGNLIYLTYEGGVHWWGYVKKYLYNALLLLYGQDN